MNQSVIQSTDAISSTAIKAIFTFQDFSEALQIPNLRLKVTFGSISKIIPLPFKDALLMETIDLLPKSKIQLQLEEIDGDIVGYAELKVPSSVFVLNETEVDQEVQFQLVKGSKTSITTNVGVIFINKKVSKDKKSIEDLKAKVQELRTITTTPSKKSLLLDSSYLDKQKSHENSPSTRKDLSTSRKEIQDVTEIQKLIQLNLHENNIPTSFLDECSILQQFEGDETTVKVTQEDVPSPGVSTIKSNHKFKRSQTLGGAEMEAKLAPKTPSGRVSTAAKDKSPMKKTVVIVEKTITGRSSLAKEKSPVVTRTFMTEEKSSVLRNSVNGEKSPRENKTVSILEKSQATKSPFSGEKSAAITRTSLAKEKSPNPRISFPQEKPAGRVLMKSKTLNIDKEKFSDEEEPKRAHVPMLSFQDPIELTDEKQLPQAFEALINELDEKQHLKAYVEFIKNTMLTMEFKINEMDIVRQENERLLEDARRAEASKTKTEENTNAALFTMKQENDTLRDKIAALINQNEGINNKYCQSQNEIIKLQESLAKQGLVLVQKENELLDANLKNSELNGAKYQLQKAQEFLDRTEGQRSEDQKNYMEALERASKAVEDARLQLEKISQERKEIGLQLAQEKLAHQDTRNQVVVLEKKLQNSEAFKETVKSLEIQRDELVRQLAEARNERDQIHVLLEKNQQTMALKLREFETRESEYILKISSIEEVVRTFEAKNSTLMRELSAAQVTISTYTLKIKEMEQLLIIHQELSREIEILRQKLQQAAQDRITLTSGIDSLVENHEAMAQRTLELERANEDLINIIAEKEEELDNVRQSLAAALNAASAPKYVPIKDDPVDNALASALNLNKDAEKYRVLFIREAEGVYQFGTKKIYIKIEGDKVLIRVGGGYMTLAELLETVAPIEYEKLTRYTKVVKDEGAKVVAKNIVLNQVIAGKCVKAFDKTKTEAYRIAKESKGDTSFVKVETTKTVVSSKMHRPPF